MAITKKQLLEWLEGKSDDAEVRIGTPAASMAVKALIHEWEDDGLSSVYLEGVLS